MTHFDAANFDTHLNKICPKFDPNSDAHSSDKHYAVTNNLQNKDEKEISQNSVNSNRRNSLGRAQKNILLVLLSRFHSKRHKFIEKQRSGVMFFKLKRAPGISGPLSGPKGLKGKFDNASCKLARGRGV